MLCMDYASLLTHLADGTGGCRLPLLLRVQVTGALGVPLQG
jgi:hypothetical protein